MEREPHDTSRRRFLKTAAFGSAGLMFGGLFRFAGNPQPLFGETSEAALMPTRRLGKTEFKVSLFGLGGEATVQQSTRRDDATAIIHRALDLGVNYIDTSPTYGSGGSETNIGKVMQSRRGEAFLATKTHDRSYDGTMRLLEDSLGRLNTDYLDLYQLHNVRLQADLDRAFAKDGAMKALRDLKEQGVVKHIGITGHRDPDVLLRGIREQEFDCLLMALNAADIYYKPFQKELLETALQQDLGIIAMKVTGVGRIFREGGISSMEQALGYTLSYPVGTAIVGVSTVYQLEENIRITREFSDLPETELRKIEQLVQPYHETAGFFKTQW